MKEKWGSLSGRSVKEVIILFIVICVLVTAFALLPLPGGDDWETFRGASQRILNGTALYEEKITHAYYSNPPWVALFFIPLSFLPFRWGWSVVFVLSVLLIVVLCRYWRLSILKVVLVLLSPATFYIFLHGQIDALVLAGILMPPEAWYLIAFTKPQVAVGLLVGVPKEKVIKALAITLFVLLLSFLLFGLWPLDIFRQEKPFLEASHNLWVGLWPFQVPAGLALLLFGIRRKDEKFLIASSPFLSPYAATSSLLGPWMALVSFLKDWETVLVFCVWWGVVLYRMMGYG